MKLSQKIKDELWWLIISVGYDYSRIAICEHELSEKGLTLWIEDKEDFKSSLDECTQLIVPLKEFKRVVNSDGLNSYDGTRTNKRGFVEKCRIEINDPSKWYQEDASVTEQQLAREAILKSILAGLLENEVYGG